VTQSEIDEGEREGRGSLGFLGTTQRHSPSPPPGPQPPTRKPAVYLLHPCQCQSPFPLISPGPLQLTHPKPAVYVNHQ